MIRMDYSNMPRRDVICIDCKSFFASVEAVKRGIHPLQAYIVVMSNQENDGGLVLAASPLVKQEYGIKTGSRRFEIPRNSKIQIVQPRMNLYIKVNMLLNNILKRYVADEDWLAYSIDESFIDVSRSHRLFGTTEEIAIKIQRDIWRELRLVVTLGIGDNPLLAKLALDNAAKHAQNGIATWHYEDVSNTIWKISPLTDMWGIGSRTEKSLARLGINTVQRLSQANVDVLKRVYGIMGQQLFYHAHGVDYSIISEKYVPKNVSFGKSQILMRDYTERNQVEVIIREMADQVAARLRKHKKMASCVHLSVGYSKDVDVRAFSKQMAISPTDTSSEIVEACLRIFDSRYEDYPVRSIAINCSKITDKGLLQLNLFTSPTQSENREQLEVTIDKIRDRYGYPALVKASSLLPGATAIKRSDHVGGHHG